METLKNFSAEVLLTTKTSQKNEDTCSQSGLIVKNILDNLQLMKGRLIDELATDTQRQKMG